jgi:hypothetical protein
MFKILAYIMYIRVKYCNYFQCVLIKKISFRLYIRGRCKQRSPKVYRYNQQKDDSANFIHFSFIFHSFNHHPFHHLSLVHSS